MIDIENKINLPSVIADCYSSGTTLGAINVSIGGQDAGSSGLVIASYDDLLDLLKVQEQSPLWNKYTDSETLVSVSDIGAVADTFLDQGNEIDSRGFKTVTLFVNFTVNDSTTNTIQVLSKHEFGGADEYVLETTVDYQKVIGDASIKVAYTFNVEGIPFLQVQTKALVLGATEGTLTIDVIKEY